MGRRRAAAAAAAAPRGRDHSDEEEDEAAAAAVGVVAAEPMAASTEPLRERLVPEGVTGKAGSPFADMLMLPDRCCCA